MYEKAISIAPENGALYFNLARAYVEISNKAEDKEVALGKLRKAIVILRESLVVRCDFKEGKVYLERLIAQEKELFQSVIKKDTSEEEKQEQGEY